MPQWQGDQSKRKTTGGKRRRHRTKRAFEAGRYPSETILGERRSTKIIARGGNAKLRLLSEKFANIMFPDTKRMERIEIERVVRNPVSVDYDRRRIVTRGAIISTRLGEAIVTSRPGQDGAVNALLLKGRA